MTIARQSVAEAATHNSRNSSCNPASYPSIFWFLHLRSQRRALRGDRTKGSIEMEPNVEAKENAAPSPRVQEGAQLRAIKAAEPNPPPAKSKSAVIRLRIILGVLALIAVVTRWGFYARHFEDTDDAQTDA